MLEAFSPLNNRWMIGLFYLNLLGRDWTLTYSWKWNLYTHTHLISMVQWTGMKHWDFSLPGKLKWNSPSSDLIKQVNVFLWSVKEGQECVMEVKLKIFEKYTNVEAVQTHVPNFILSCNVSKSCLSCSIVVLWISWRWLRPADVSRAFISCYFVQLMRVVIM